MPVTKAQVQSQALDRLVTYAVALPDPKQAGPDPYHVLLMLHGAYDDHTSWLHDSKLLQYTDALPFIVVLPDGANSMWSNLASDMRYEDFVMHDLWQHVENTFAVKKGERWAVGGVSMGGFGAIRLGLKYPEKFFSVYAHSSLLPTQKELNEWFPDLDSATLADLDCYRWAEQITPAQLPTLSFDCGTEDGLLKNSRLFHAHLEKLGLPHTYLEYPGGHTWDYWNQHLQTALQQHVERMKDEG
jgi:S-formylglutathione hydrolase FrmB